MNTTERQAAQSWAAGFQLLPASIIEAMAETDPEMYDYDSDSFRLVASPAIECDWCTQIYQGPHSLHELDVLAESGRPEHCSACDLNDGFGWVHSRLEHHYPWGNLFVPGREVDRAWILKHTEEVARLGFFVFRSDDFGCLLGIDGADDDFCEKVWVPLYRLRRLERHDTD